MREETLKDLPVGEHPKVEYESKITAIIGHNTLEPNERDQCETYWYTRDDDSQM